MSSFVVTRIVHKNYFCISYTHCWSTFQRQQVNRASESLYWRSQPVFSIPLSALGWHRHIVRFWKRAWMMELLSLKNDSHHCTMCSLGSTLAPCPKTEIQKPLSLGKKLFLRLFFLCSFRMKTLKLVSLFIFRHWKHYFWSTQNREK